MNQLNEIFESLYIGSFDYVTGLISGKFGDPIEVQLRGEILLEGEWRDDGFFEVLRIPRVAILGGQPGEYRKDDPIGTLSLWGPVDEIGADQITNSKDENEPGSVDMLLNLNYQRLYEKRLSSKTVEEANLETISTHLEWTRIDRSGMNHATFGKVSFEAVNTNGYFERLEFELPEGEIYLYRSGSELPEHGPYDNHNHLSPPPEVLNPDCTDEAPGYITKWRLPIRFINLSGVPNENVRTTCETQLKAVREIWCKKAALDVIWPKIRDNPDDNRLIVPDEIIDGFEHNADFKDFINNSPLGGTKAKNISNVPSLLENLPNPFTFVHTRPYINVFIVNTLQAEGEDGPTKEGITYDYGLNTAFCILSLLKMKEIEHLLAHEICHVLGLGHPHSPENKRQIPGSENSIADPDALGENAKKNTQKNIEVLFKRLLSNPILLTDWVFSCYRLDG